MKSNKTLYETALEVAYNDRKELMQKDDSHKALLYKEAFETDYTGYEYAYEGAKETREDYLKPENKQTELEKYWERYYNGERKTNFASTPYVLTQYQAVHSQEITAQEEPKKNINMKEYVLKKKARAKSFFWAIVGIVVGAGAMFAAHHFFL